MDLIRYSIVFISAVSLTLAALNLNFLFKGHRRWEVLALITCCVSTAMYSWFEVALMGTHSVAAYGEMMRWAHIPVMGIFVGVAAFLRRRIILITALTLASGGRGTP